MTDSRSLSPAASALLLTVARSEAGRDGHRVATDRAAVDVVGILASDGSPTLVVGAPPWFGLSDAADELRDRAVVTVDPGLAQPTMQESKTPAKYFVVTTDDRLRAAIEALPLLGELREKSLPTHGSQSRPKTVFDIEFDLQVGRTFPYCRASGDTLTEALAIAYLKAMELLSR